jgi:trans-2,3-dihydro-3-hydroxyanthranilate isomerase
MPLRFYTLDVFTDRAYGGNPLAVVPDADALSTAQMQTIAREFNLSETVFFQKPELKGSLLRARIFTPGKELPFAGHPTVGAACLIVDLGLAPPGAETSAFMIEEGVGAVPVTVQRVKDQPPFAQLTTAVLPSFGPPPPPPLVLAEILGLAATDIESAQDAPRSASCGVPFLLVPLKSRAALARARLRLDRWEAVLSKYWATEIFLYCREPENLRAQFRARMFAPNMGIGEDPATGAAAAAFAGAMADRDPCRDGKLLWMVEQGYEMGRPSQLYIEADRRGGETVAVRVGGYAVRVSEGTIKAP